MDYKTSKKSAKKNRKNGLFLFRLVWRTTVFLFFYLTAMFFFYICGSYQGFMDSTQRFILLLCALTSIVLLIITMTGAAISVFQFIRTRRKRTWGFFSLHILIAVFAVVVFAISRTVSILSTGI